MLSSHLILCSLLLLWPSVFPSIGIFSSLHQVGQSIGSFSFSISPSNEYSGLVSFIKAGRQRLGFPSGPAVQNPPAAQEPQKRVRAPEGGHGSPLQRVAWEVPGTEESGRRQFTGSQRVGHHSHARRHVNGWMLLRSTQVFIVLLFLLLSYIWKHFLKGFKRLTWVNVVAHQHFQPPTLLCLLSEAFE